MEEFIDETLDENHIFSEYVKIEIHLIKKYDIETSGIPEKLYHVTEKKNIKNIFKQGLKPKNKNKIENHPERIYFLDSFQGAQDLIDIFVENGFGLLKDFEIIEINSKLLKKIKLYLDPTYYQDEIDYNNSEVNAYYTYDNISPLIIKIKK